MSRRPAPDDGRRRVDVALAALLQRLDPSTSPAVREAAAEAMRAVADGHAAYDLGDGEDTGLVAALRASRFVASPGPGVEADAACPLVLEHDLLYLRRYREYERRLAAGLRRLAAHAAPTAPAAPSSPLFAQLFPHDEGDLQARAAAVALARALVLVTGGPGTGKTTTVARILALLVERQLASGAPAPRIALAAPTGRAAERMAQSLHAATASLRDAGVDVAVCDALPTQARTLHRLLGTQGSGPGFRHDAAHPLPHDIVVVDEASMVDLPLMCKLVEAVPDGARLILLGDPDQLPAVEAGDVLSAMVAATDAPSLAGHRVHLQRGYRQSASLDLAPLAIAVRQGDADAAIARLREGLLDGVHWYPAADALTRSPLRDALLDPWRELTALSDPGEALRQAGRQRLLVALRNGPEGAEPLNDSIEQALAGARRERYFHGRLLLVTENSYRHGLFNGDTGICLRDASGATVAWFPGGGGDAVRGFHPAALPAHTGAFAMTVHKAQGSEFDRAWVVLPARDHPLLSRELLYTALTRARDEVHLCAGEEVLRAALARRVRRVSGLARRLLDAT